MAVRLHQTAVNFARKYEEHEDCAHPIHITPKSYLEMMRGLKKLLIEKHFDLTER